MAINETKEHYTLALVDYFNSIMMEYKDSSDKKSRDFVFKTLMKKNREIVEDILVNQPNHSW